MSCESRRVAIALIVGLLFVTAAPRAAEAQTQVITNVTYCSPNGFQLLMDLYLPESSGSPAPIVVDIHGGDWISGSKSDEWALAMYPLLNAKGIGLASINYRLAPGYEFPAQIEDAACAVRYLRANAGLYNIESSEIGVFGDSAGAQMALLLAMTGGATQWPGDGQWAGYSSAVQAVVDWFGPSQLTQRGDFSSSVDYRIAQTFGTSDSELREASPLTYVSASAPPTLIEHGLEDHVVKIPQSVELASALASHGATYSFIQVNNAGHSWVQSGTQPMSPSLAQIEQDAATWFAEYL